MAEAYPRLRDLAAVELLSTDVFDTVLMRDSTTETQRLAIAADRSAARLGVDASGLRQLRWYAQEAAYRAVALADPAGEASLARICTVLARSLGLNLDAAQIMEDTEVGVDIEHLHPNPRLVELLRGAAAASIRVIAVSDTMYTPADLRRMFAAVLPEDPYAEVYTSSQLDRTKHDGGMFPAVIEREQVDPARVLHIGDHPKADLRNAERAGWRAVHVPRSSAYRLQRIVGGVAASGFRRARSR